MMENEEMMAGQSPAEMREWMRRVEESNAQQAKYAKKQYHMARLGAICNVCVLLIVIACVLVLSVKFSGTFERLDSMLQEMETVAANLEDASAALAEADLAGMLKGVNSLVEDSQAGVAEAMEKIAALDIETMNEAITDLKSVVEPLAKLFKR